MARKERKYHYLYRITSLKNNRYYIGMHSTDNLDDGYFGGGKRIKNSVKKHGRDAHRKEILEFFENRELLRQREIQIVNEDLLKDPLCMNLQPGGGGGFVNDEHMKSFIKAGAEKYSTRLKTDMEFRGMILKNLSDHAKKRSLDGLIKIPNWKGKNHSLETKKKIGDKNSIHQNGRNNSQYGTIWIYNKELKLNKKIRKDESIPEGWELGRKMKFFRF